MPLTDVSIRAAKATDGKPIKLFDGGGLFLFVTPAGNKVWRMKYRHGGKEKVLVIGSYPAVTLSRARRGREEAKALLAEGLDPCEVKRKAAAGAEAERQEQHNTFRRMAEGWFASYSPGLSDRHAARLRRYLDRIVLPALGDRALVSLKPEDFLAIVRPIENLGHITTSHKIMQICRQTMQYAHLTGKIQYNPTAGLSSALQPLHHKNQAAILDPAGVGQLLRDIDSLQGVAFPSISFFLQILPMVFTRPSELRRARWEEVNTSDRLWVVPACRMKLRRDHLVPLSRQVLEKLDALRQFSGGGEFLFPSVRAHTATISDAGPLAALRRMGYQSGEQSLHGFRAIASTLLNESGEREAVIEAQLAHKDPDATRRAYNRAAYLEERRGMMQRWADRIDQLRAGAN